MNASELIELFRSGGKRFLVVGSSENGIIAGLDLEGRLYAVMNGKVLNRVNPAAVTGISSRAGYLNPGGDGLWPAPEGTTKGYQYASGEWRVPPGLTGARFLVVEQDSHHARIEAEIDLINAEGQGIPTIFGRDITVEVKPETLTVKVIESIRYLGTRSLMRNECLLAPWSLCQFDCGPGCEVILPADNAELWDLYEPSNDCRYERNGMIHLKTDSSQRWQVGIGPNVPWIEFHKPAESLTVRRSALPLMAGQKYIDIADAAPDIAPLDKETRYSVYSDTGSFMEIEAVGGCPDVVEPGTELSVTIITEYQNKG
ncbi:MAG: hypothetical protein PHV75_07890 [Victivallaceae bacterium]|nr:hypothetical protein [Victivallaceae bacterium]MDD3703910.1 hypothetical protein [Victivallaceae bacterium]MDD4318426.1 hypothetical protein [Victivallaceae bacterium]MDD5663687.1 hypothetical protein [Victivallaceae bacterium]NLK82711.1 hypothetical protein [Lentisphaerota bacterium]